MTERAHMWIRLVAVVVIVAIAWLPRGGGRADNERGRHSHAGSERTAEVARR